MVLLQTIQETFVAIYVFDVSHINMQSDYFQIYEKLPSNFDPVCKLHNFFFFKTIKQ